MKPITKENRELIVAAKERGEKPETIAIWFEIAVSSRPVLKPIIQAIKCL